MDYLQNFDGMRAVGLHAANCLDVITTMVYPGKTTGAIDAYVKWYADEYNLICAPYGYRGYPAYCCTSVNHVVCHGIPTASKILKEGDIVKVDVTFRSAEGWHGDSCRTYRVGKVSVLAERLIRVTQTILDKAIEQCVAGAKLGIVGKTIMNHLYGTWFTSVRQYCGHGIGQEFHTRPIVLHYFEPNEPDSNLILEPGMMFTIEPMICAGEAETKVLKDGWTVVTRDRSLSAQFEHTIGINKEGPPEVFTR